MFEMTSTTMSIRANVDLYYWCCAQTLILTNERGSERRMIISSKIEIMVTLSKFEAKHKSKISTNAQYCIELT
jgi:hypothetical protein